MDGSVRGMSKSAVLWSGAAVLLALTWLLPDLRGAVVPYFGLYASVAVACGVGALALMLTRGGRMRIGGIALLLLLSWVIAVSWVYLNRRHPENFGWLGAITSGLGAVLPPVLIAAICANGKGGPGWTFAQVTSLAILAAPLSSMAALFLYVLILRDGP